MVSSEQPREQQDHQRQPGSDGATQAQHGGAPESPAEPEGAQQGREPGAQAKHTQRPSRERREPAPAEADVKVDENAQALVALLDNVLKEHEPEMTAVVGDVVATVGRDHLIDAATRLRDDPKTACDYLRCLSAVDYEDHFEVVYHLYSIERSHRFVLKVVLPYDDPTLPSLISVWPGADWYEREAHDLYGIVFDGHPDLSPLLLYEGFEGYPGRRSYPINDYQEW